MNPALPRLQAPESSDDDAWNHAMNAVVLLSILVLDRNLLDDTH